jgi:hypothetical protein
MSGYSILMRELSISFERVVEEFTCRTVSLLLLSCVCPSNPSNCETVFRDFLFFCHFCFVGVPVCSLLQPPCSTSLAICTCLIQNAFLFVYTTTSLPIRNCPLQNAFLPVYTTISLAIRTCLLQNAFLFVYTTISLAICTCPLQNAFLFVYTTSQYSRNWLFLISET